MEKPDKILVLDFGSQYTHLLARRVRDLGVFSEIKQPTVATEELLQAKGIILSGGPQSVYDKKGAPKYNPKIFGLGIPVLGLCYGQQLMAHHLKGKVKAGKTKEYGKAKVRVLKKTGVLKGLSKSEAVWMSHGDSVQKMPSGFERIGSTGDCPVAAMQNMEKKLFGLQFHPEVTHTVHGMKILSNFVFGICGCEKNWKIEDFLEQKIDEIRKQVGEKKVFLFASGGVDSTVALALIERALPAEKVSSIHVDHGFMRKNESEKVKNALEKAGVKNLKVIDAKEEFMTKLFGVTDPEKKRRIIGELFVKVIDKYTRKLDVSHGDWVLAQGTIYPDTIETKGTQNAAHIKTHHNQAEIIKRLTVQGKVIEPLRELYKDEVRKLGEKLGLPHDLVWRQPFPGPGLAIRCICSNGREKVPQELEKAVKKTAKKNGFQAIVLPVKAVGVQGDDRSYSFVAALSGKMDWKKLDKTSTEITNRHREINRVVYTLFPKKISSLKLEKAFLSRERVEFLQEADDLVMKTIEMHGLSEKIWQFPTVLLPLTVNDGREQALVLRPVLSAEAMTAEFFVLPEKTLSRIVNAVKALGASAVFYDVTHKPPATIEWE